MTQYQLAQMALRSEQLQMRVRYLMARGGHDDAARDQ